MALEQLIRSRIPAASKPVKVVLFFTAALWQAQVVQVKGKHLVLGTGFGETIEQAVTLAFDSAEKNGYGK